MTISISGCACRSCRSQLGTSPSLPSDPPSSVLSSMTWEWWSAFAVVTTVYFIFVGGTSLLVDCSFSSLKLSRFAQTSLGISIHISLSLGRHLKRHLLGTCQPGLVSRWPHGMRRLCQPLAACPISLIHIYFYGSLSHWSWGASSSSFFVLWGFFVLKRQLEVNFLIF